MNGYCPRNLYVRHVVVIVVVVVFVCLFAYEGRVSYLTFDS